MAAEEQQTEPVVEEVKIPTNKQVGKQLKEERVGKNLEMETIAGHLKIRAHLLKAMEEGRFEDLPGGVYTRGYIKNYAEHLGLEAKPLVEAVEVNLANVGKDEKEDEMLPEPYRPSFSPSPVVILVSVLACLALYGAWYWEHKPTAATHTKRDRQVLAHYTESKHTVALVANDVTRLTLMKLDGSLLTESDMQLGDTYFVPQEEDVIMRAEPVDAVEVYVDGEMVASLGHLEGRDGGFILNTDKLLAGVEVE